jgi:hypothetical protein
LFITFAGGVLAEVPVPMQPLQGHWAAQGSAWQTQGERPPAGWYLRSSRQYDLGSFSFELKRTDAAELVFVYTRDWQIVLRGDSVTARYSNYEDGKGKSAKRTWGNYWNTATRPLAWPGGHWSRFRVTTADGGISIAQDGRELLRFHSPEAEWGKRVRTSGKYPSFEYRFPDTLAHSTGSKQVLILQAYGSGMQARNIEVDGRDAGAAEDFHTGAGKPEAIAQEEDLPLHRVRGTVKVDWALPAEAVAEIAALPPTGKWEVPASAYLDTDSTSAARVAPGEKVHPEIMRYRIGAAVPGNVPKLLAIKSRLPAMPQECRIAFNLAKAGLYTFQLGWGDNGLGWGPAVIELSVDGKPLVLEQYRSLHKFGIGASGREWLQLDLPAGPHEIAVRLVTDRFGLHILMKLMRFPIREMRLIPGAHEPWEEVDVRAPTAATQKSPAIDDDFLIGDWSGAERNYRLRGLVAGQDYRVALTFADVESTRAESRLMAVRINGAVVQEKLDIFAEAGWGKRLDKTFVATARRGSDGGGVMEIEVTGTRRKTILSGIELRDAAGAVVFRDNLGWHARLAQIQSQAAEREGSVHLLKEGISAEPPRWTPAEVFDGHNLIPNPHFSLADPGRADRPLYWRSVAEMAEVKNKMGNPFPHYGLYLENGDYGLDTREGRTHPGALRVARTEKKFALISNMPLVDQQRRQRFSFFVKGRPGAAPVRAAFLWFAANMDGDREPLATPSLQFLEAVRGAPVQPGADWQEVSVEALPHRDAYYMACIVEVPDNGADLWIDDAEHNGYGAEPLEIARSQAGYHPAGDKAAIVSSLQAGPVAWKMLSAQGTTVAAGQLTGSRSEWFAKRNYFTLRFDDVREEGDYTLEVTQAGQSVRKPVRIDRAVYRNLALTELGALRMKRVNDDVPNGHDPDLLDYAAVPLTRTPDRFAIYEAVQFAERLDLTGGYYDAGDQIKHVEFWPAVVLATLNAVEKAGADSELARAAHAEAAWILAAFHKFVLEDGTVYITAKPQGSSLDNIPGYAFDPVPSFSSYVTQTAGASAMAAFRLRESDPKLSRRYLELAELCYNRPALWKIVQGAGPIGPRETSAAAKVLWAEMFLAKLKPAGGYRERLQKTCAVLEQGLKARAYADLSEMANGADKSGAAIQDCAWVPALFVREYPDHPAVQGLKAAMKAFASHVAEVSGDTIWQQAAAMNGAKSGRPPARYPNASRNSTRFRVIGYWSMLTFTLAEIGMAVEDPEIVRLAERQLQWCLGKNFADLSMVMGIGEKFISAGDKLWWQDRYFAHWLASKDGAMFFPGNIVTTAFRGIGAAEPAAAMLAPFVIYPKGYSMLPVQPPYGVAPGPGGETYLPLIAQFSLAASSLDAALRWVEKDANAKTRNAMRAR